jgi:hypothetical protein
MDLCWPWFHPIYQPLVGTAIGNTKLASGCAVNSAGNVPCRPEDMRAAAQTRLAQLGYPRALSLETYTLARYMQGEVGGGTVEERVAVGEAAVNRARRENLPMGVLSLLLFRQKEGHPNRGWYGPIHGVGTGTSTAPYGRWATTSADPTVLTTLLADLVMSGESDNFSRGADDQDGPEYWIPQGQTSLNNYVKRLASEGKYWVGPLPGIDHWHTFLQFTPSKLTLASTKTALYLRGLEALQLPRSSPSWPSNLPVCSRSASTFSLVVTTLLAASAGAWAFRRYAHKL